MIRESGKRFDNHEKKHFINVFQPRTEVVSPWMNLKFIQPCGETTLRSTTTRFTSRNKTRWIPNCIASKLHSELRDLHRNEFSGFFSISFLFFISQPVAMSAWRWKGSRRECEELSSVIRKKSCSIPCANLSYSYLRTSMFKTFPAPSSDMRFSPYLILQYTIFMSVKKSNEKNRTEIIFS